MRFAFRALAAIFLALTASIAVAQAPRPRPDRAALDAILDPSISLAFIDKAVASGKEDSIPAGRFFLITGRMGVLVDRTADGEDSPFHAESELTGGEWVGLKSILSYRAFLEFDGDRFLALEDEGSDKYIKPGAMVMVIGYYTGKKESYGEGAKRNTAVIEVERIISID